MSERFVFRLVLALSSLVFLLVILLNERVFPAPEHFPDLIYRLPLLNASINGTVSILLLFSYRAIKRKRVDVHKRINLTAFFFSAVFLISYVTYHYLVGHTVYGGHGLQEIVYKSILYTHIVLAAVVLPLVLLSFYYGLNSKLDRHRKLVRWAFPIWLYVAVSGVIVFLMISPYYPQ